MTDDEPEPIWPMPGPNHPTIPSDEYRQLEQAVNDYLEADETERPIRHADVTHRFLADLVTIEERLRER